MRGSDFMYAFYSYNRSRSNQKCHHHKSDERLNFPMSVGMIGIRRSPGIAETEKYQKRGQNIRGRLDGIGNEGIAMSEYSTQKFDDCEQYIPCNAEVRGTYSRLEIIQFGG